MNPLVPTPSVKIYTRSKRAKRAPEAGARECTKEKRIPQTRTGENICYSISLSDPDSSYIQQRQAEKGSGTRSFHGSVVIVVPTTYLVVQLIH